MLLDPTPWMSLGDLENVLQLIVFQVNPPPPRVSAKWSFALAAKTSIAPPAPREKGSLVSTN